VVHPDAGLGRACCSAEPDQRPNFRVSQLEEEVGRCRSQLQQCQGELAGKEADNVSLYEKIRYLQRYSSNQQTGSSDSVVNFVQVDDAGVAQPKASIATMCVW